MSILSLSQILFFAAQLPRAFSGFGSLIHLFFISLSSPTLSAIEVRDISLQNGLPRSSSLSGYFTQQELRARSECCEAGFRYFFSSFVEGLLKFVLLSEIRLQNSSARQTSLRPRCRSTTTTAMCDHNQALCSIQNHPRVPEARVQSNRESSILMIMTLEIITTLTMPMLCLFNIWRTSTIIGSGTV